MRKLSILFGLCITLLCRGSSHAAEMVNVEYVHKAIEHYWDITVPYNQNLKNVKVAANMKYLLTAIDRANEILNGKQTTDYGNSEYANLKAADTIATLDAADRLIRYESKFFITTTADTTEFTFTMSAAGDFTVDWGDGRSEHIKRSDTTATEYSHKYDDADKYTIGIGGITTGYSSGGWTATIAFTDNKNVAAIDGSLGALFPTIGDGATAGNQPRFYNTFKNCSNLDDDIPADLFTGVTGAPVRNMFCSTFEGCTKLNGQIPGTLFAGVSGAPAIDMFAYTFKGCGGLTGSIPANLFARISGAPVSQMFAGVFRDCKGLTGSIPENLFAGIEGSPATSMFAGGFYGCANLSGTIPANLFVNVSGAPAERMFEGTFAGCKKLRDEIPAGLFGKISGNPAPHMFESTFSSCENLTSIGDGLFAGINGAPADSMFRYTFGFCENLTSIPQNLFGNINGDAADQMFVGMFKFGHNLTGQSARINGRYLYEIWPDTTDDQTNTCYEADRGLADYADIPANWR